MEKSIEDKFKDAVTKGFVTTFFIIPSFAIAAGITLLASPYIVALSINNHKKEKKLWDINPNLYPGFLNRRYLVERRSPRSWISRKEIDQYLKSTL